MNQSGRKLLSDNFRFSEEQRIVGRYIPKKKTYIFLKETNAISYVPIIFEIKYVCPIKR